MTARKRIVLPVCLSDRHSAQGIETVVTGRGCVVVGRAKASAANFAVAFAVAVAVAVVVVVVAASAPAQTLTTTIRTGAHGEHIVL